MNDVNLNGQELKLARISEQAPARAMSSSKAGSGNASGFVGSPAAEVASIPQASRVPAVANAEQAQDKASQGQLGQAVSQLNEYVQSVQRDLQFEVNNDLGQTVVRVIDQQTREVIRQIPDEVVMRLAENLQQDEPLTLFDTKV